MVQEGAGMQVVSYTEARVRELLRQCAPPLDAVIEQAKQDLAQEEASEARAKLALLKRRKLKGLGAVVMVLNRTGPLGGDGGRAAESGSSESDSQGNVRERKTSTEGKADGTFAFAVKTFMGGRADGSRAFPHKHGDNNILRALGERVTKKNIHHLLRDAQLRKFDDDVERMENCEKTLNNTLLTQADGEKLKFGRLDPAWDHRLQYAAKMYKRGQIATWNWRTGHYVLCEGILHGFTDSSLIAPLLGAWPVLGATLRQSVVSKTIFDRGMEDKPFKYCFELTVHEFFVSDSILATIEFACDSAEELSRWMMAIESASLAVSKDFKQTHDREAQTGSHTWQESRAHEQHSPNKTPRSGRGTKVKRRLAGSQLVISPLQDTRVAPRRDDRPLGRSVSRGSDTKVSRRRIQQL
jgi:hypothetical protein